MQHLKIYLWAFFLLLGTQVFAQGGSTVTPAPTPGGSTVTPAPPTQFLPNPLGDQTIPDVLCRIGGWLFTIAIPLTAIMIIIGAFQIMFAGGNEEKVATGKRTIIYTVVGFAIILSATGIIYVIQELLNIGGEKVCGY
jgi:hypothetical protein